MTEGSRSRSPAGRPASRCCRCRSTRTRRCRPALSPMARSGRRLHPGGEPGEHRGRPRRHAPDPHRRRVEIDGDKVTLLATDRYRLAMRELTWNPGAADASHLALIPARTPTDMAKALGAAGSVGLAFGRAGAGDRLVGFDAGQRRHDPAARRGTPRSPRSSPPRSTPRRSSDRSLRRGSQTRRPRRRAQHPGRLRFEEGQVAIEAGTGEGRSGLRGRRGHARPAPA